MTGRAWRRQRVTLLLGSAAASPPAQARRRDPRGLGTGAQHAHLTPRYLSVLSRATRTMQLLSGSSMRAVRWRETYGCRPQSRPRVSRRNESALRSARGAPVPAAAAVARPAGQPVPQYSSSGSGTALIRSTSGSIEKTCVRTRGGCSARGGARRVCGHRSPPQGPAVALPPSAASWLSRAAAHLLKDEPEQFQHVDAVRRGAEDERGAHRPRKLARLRARADGRRDGA
jgi:hypothetical protein